MSFVDMAYLRKKDLTNGFIRYRRKKTGQLLIVELADEGRKIISKYTNRTQYLLPIITIENGEERKQYQGQLLRINRHLKTIGKLIGLPVPLSTYVVRHACAIIARDKGIELSIISEGLGMIMSQLRGFIWILSVPPEWMKQIGQSLMIYNM